MPLLRWLWSPYREAAATLLAAAESILVSPRPPWSSLAALILATVAAWFVYVPVHELLHALGCFATGGRVEELQIAPLYGGRLLERVFPFVRAAGEHAGRLSGFDTGGSDLTYLATDIAPYLLTIIGAVPLLSLARRRRSAILFGPGFVLIAAPLMSLVGDYFEMAGILVSRALAGITTATHADVLRCDDLVDLLAEFPARIPDHRIAWGLAILGTLLVACLLVTATLAATIAVGRRFAGERGGARAGGSGYGP